MAEYIDKNVAIQICMNSWDASDAAQDIKDESLADVIEREKIDNALADMQLMLDQEVLGDNVISDVGQGIAIAMGLLRTNIGE